LSGYYESLITTNHAPVILTVHWPVAGKIPLVGPLHAKQR
jgi:hypothetical protein